MNSLFSRCDGGEAFADLRCALASATLRSFDPVRQSGLGCLTNQYQEQQRRHTDGHETGAVKFSGNDGAAEALLLLPLLLLRFCAFQKKAAGFLQFLRGTPQRGSTVWLPMAVLVFPATAAWAGIVSANLLFAGLHV